MIHPAIRPVSVDRLLAAAPPDGAGAPAPPAEPARPVAVRAKALVRRVAAPVVARMGDQVAAGLRAELDADRSELAELRDELVRTRSSLEAEIELLRAEVEGLAGPGVSP